MKQKKGLKQTHLKHCKLQHFLDEVNTTVNQYSHYTKQNNDTNRFPLKYCYTVLQACLHLWNLFFYIFYLLPRCFMEHFWKGRLTSVLLFLFWPESHQALFSPKEIAILLDICNKTRFYCRWTTNTIIYKSKKKCKICSNQIYINQNPTERFGRHHQDKTIKQKIKGCSSFQIMIKTL